VSILFQFLALCWVRRWRVADGDSAVDYLLNGSNRRAGTATALLVIYFVLMLPMLIAYFRLLYIVLFDPGFVALGRPAEEHNANSKRQRRVGARDDGVGGREYEAPSKKVVNWHTDADAPGLEEFYSRDVFVCEMDGRPKWCTECGCWKPDRAHHCSDVGRCVRKMDHFCPWYVCLVPTFGSKICISVDVLICTGWGALSERIASSSSFNLSFIQLPIAFSYSPLWHIIFMSNSVLR